MIADKITLGLVRAQWVTSPTKEGGSAVVWSGHVSKPRGLLCSQPRASDTARPFARSAKRFNPATRYGASGLSGLPDWPCTQ